jgi:hypothetical protein
MVAERQDALFHFQGGYFVPQSLGRQVRSRSRSADRQSVPDTRFDSPDLVIWNDASGGSEIGISARRAVFTIVSAKGSIWLLENVDR